MDTVQQRCSKKSIGDKMSIQATIKRAKKILKQRQKTVETNATKNQCHLYKETDEFDSDPKGALVIILKED